MEKSKPFAVFDIDGTLIRWQMLHAIYDRLGREGRLLENDYAALRAARLNWKERKIEEGFRAYEAKVVEIVERNLTRLSPRDFDRVAQEAFIEYKDQVYRYTRDLLAGLKQKGYFIIAISGSPEEIVKHLAEYYGFDDFAATIHEQKAGRYTGKIMVATMHKPELLKSLTKNTGLVLPAALAWATAKATFLCWTWWSILWPSILPKTVFARRKTSLESSSRAQKYDLRI